ncbi:hypothetical protein ACS0TY_020553 [Phlomoides rotata]
MGDLPDLHLHHRLRHYHPITYQRRKLATELKRHSAKPPASSSRHNQASIVVVAVPTTSAFLLISNFSASAADFVPPNLRRVLLVCRFLQNLEVEVLGVSNHRGTFGERRPFVEEEHLQRKKVTITFDKF